MRIRLLWTSHRMRRLLLRERVVRIAVLVGFLLLVGGTPANAITLTADFEGLSPFLSPGLAIPGLVVSPDGAILDEAAVAAVTGLSFPPGSVATSGTNVLGNLYGPSLTITFLTPVQSVSLNAVGSVSDGAVGTITMTAFSGGSVVGSASSDPNLIGDSGAPESSLSVLAPAITSVTFASDIGASATFVLDDLTYVLVPEPGVASLLSAGLLLLIGRMR